MIITLPYTPWLAKIPHTWLVHYLTHDNYSTSPIMIITQQDFHLPFPWSDGHKHSTSQQSVGNQSTERNGSRTSAHSYTATCVYRDFTVLTMHASFFLGFPMYSGGITWIHVYICVSAGWGGIGVSAGIFPLYIIISVICYPCLATCTYTSLFLVIIHQQKHQCLQIPGIWCIKCVPIHHMFSC